MSFLLLIKAGIPQLKFSLGKTSTMGRASVCEIQVPDLKTSRRHALIYCDQDQYYLKDLESENGTYLNGKRIRTLNCLQKGDEILIGDQRFIFDPPLDMLYEKEGDKAVLLVNDDPKDVPSGEDLSHDLSNNNAHENFYALYELMCDIAAELDLSGLLNKLMDRLMGYFEADRGYILGYNASSGEIKPLAVRCEKNTIALSRTLLNRTAVSKTPVLIFDALEDITFNGGKSILKHQLRSVMLVPLCIEDRVIGFIQLDKTIKNAFDRKALKTLVLISKAAASALNNARKYEIEQKKRLNGIGGPKKFTLFIGQSPRVVEILNAVEKAAASRARVLITGESGTGKELIARLIHEQSPRAEQPLISINCAAIAENLLESEFFGHEKGAFSGAVKQKKGCFELADGGTLFLDEIAEMRPVVQVKLLRAIQEGRFYRVGGEKPIAVDVRIIAATNRNLKAQIQENLFREDLYYRLNVIQLDVPPLRERKPDIARLCDYFLGYFAGQEGRPAPTISPEAAEILKRYDWPGNVRELQNVIERIIVLTDALEIRAVDLPLELRLEAGLEKQTGHPERMGRLNGSLQDMIESIEKEMLLNALEKANHKKVDAAKMLGISRPTLDKKLKMYAL